MVEKRNCTKVQWASQTANYDAQQVLSGVILVGIDAVLRRILSRQRARRLLL